MDAAVRASAAFFGVGGSKDAMVSWSAARAWRVDGVSVVSASARAASLRLVEHRALWEFLCFSILRREVLWLGALRCCCCNDVFRVLLPRRPSAIALLLGACCVLVCEVLAAPQPNTLASM
jgi:hypothetical protein